MPLSGPLRFSRAEIAGEAAMNLADGIGDPAGAMLAARLLTVNDGWRALAVALVSADAHPSRAHAA